MSDTTVLEDTVLAGDDPSRDRGVRIMRILTGAIKTVLSLDELESELTPDTDLYDLGIDSMNIIDLVMAIEHECQIQFAEHELSAELFQRVENLIVAISRHLA